MSYTVAILRRAQKELAALPDDAYGRLRDAIRSLAGDPTPRDCRKLTAREGWRLRVGDYRLIYEIDNDRQIVTVLHVGHRRDIYR